MTRRKAFILRIEIDIHSVHGQGVRLCHADTVTLKVNALNATAVTMPARASFPIHFCETLVFEKLIDCVTTLADVQDHLTKESLRMELLQWPRHHSRTPTVVARFRTKLSNLLFPILANKDLVDGGNIKLLMEPAEKYPGSVAPKVEVSTKTTVEETIRGRLPERDAALFQAAVQTAANPICCCGKRGSMRGCGCQAAGDCVQWPGTKNSSVRESSCHRPARNGTGSCNECCICTCYADRMEPKPFAEHRSRSCSCTRTREESRGRQQHRPGKHHVCLRSPRSLSSWETHSGKSKYTFDEADAHVPCRQIFYDNLDYFYRQLRDDKCKRTYT